MSTIIYKNTCKICKGNPFIPGQYFMVKDKLWKEICNKNKLSYKSLICKNCFEKLLGRKLREEDLKDCPLNKIYKKRNIKYYG